MRTAEIGPDLRLPKIRRICKRKTILATQSRFPYNVLVNSEIFKLSLNLSLTHLRVQIACYKLKGDLVSVMLKKILYDSLKISKFTRICMENYSSVTGWQKLFSHTNPSNFRRPLQSLLFCYTAGNLQVT